MTPTIPTPISTDAPEPGVPRAETPSWADRALQQEQERLRRLLGGVPEIVRDQVLARARQKAIETGAIWKSGVEPVAFDVFCSAHLELELRDLQRAIFLESGTIRARDILDPARLIQILVIVYGKGAGKDLVIAAFIAYLAYVVLSLKDAHATYNVHPDTRLAIINVAPSKELAQQVFFDYLKKNVEKPVFAPFLTNQRLQVGTDKIDFPQARLTLFSKHSNPKTLEGFSPIAAVIDEGDDFLDSENKSTADACFKVLRTSARTRYRHVKPLLILISYPRTEDGFMMREFRHAARDPVYYRKLATTFEVRPEISPDDPDIRSDFERDPRDAAARYLCQPMAAIDAFFEYPERITDCIDPTLVPCARVLHGEPRREEMRNGEVREYTTLAVEDIVRKPGATYFLGGDAGHKDDAYTLVVMHIEESADASLWLCPEHANDPVLRQAANYVAWEGEGSEIPLCGICMREARAVNYSFERGWWRRAPEDADPIRINGREWRIPHVYEDLVVEFRPRRAQRPGERDQPVDFLAVQAVAEALIQHLGIRKARFDPWSTPQLQQHLVQATGADVGEISFSNPEQYRRARMAKLLVYQRRLSLLDGAACGLATVNGEVVRDREWRQIQRKGNSVDHPENGSKDVWDAETVAIWLAVTHKCSELEISWT